MSDIIEKTSRFWQELKRRNVIRRNTVYAATAFVLLELISIIQEPLGLPDWTLLFLIVILSVGFIISIIISWIYDINPEGNLEKTKALPRETSNPDKDKAGSSSNWKIASYISFVLIIFLIALNLFPRSARNSHRVILDKSIAVLPFINDSPEKENEYFINGTMEAILDNLSRIQELRVISRTSVEKYRGTEKPTVPEIASELNVGYILEGSGQKSGDQIRLFVQLLDGKTDEHLWSKDFIRKIDDIFALQSEIAQFVAAELETIITPQEEEMLAKIPTTSQTAYEFYEKGRVEINKYWANKEQTELLDQAEILFRYALEYDSTFAGPWEQLAHIYEQKFFVTDDRQSEFLDTLLYFSEKALTYDPTSPEANNFKGWFYQITGKPDVALEAFKTSLRYKPNNFKALRGLGDLHKERDVIKALDYYFKGLEIENGDWYVAAVASQLSFIFMDYGFEDLSYHYLDVMYNTGFELVDTTFYHARNALIRFTSGERSDAIGDLEMILSENPLQKFSLEFSAMFHLLEKQYDKALGIYQEIAELEDSIGWQLWYPGWYGYLLTETGNKAKGQALIDKQLAHFLEQIDQNNKWLGLHIRAAEIFAYTEEREKALEHLKLFTQIDGLNRIHLLYLEIPLFDNLRNDPEFQIIFSEMNSIVQATHDEIELWLAENDLPKL
jgi:TolB-like protein